MRKINCIILDIEPYTLSNPDGSPVITNKGTLTIASGTFLTRSNASNATVITNTKTLTMTGGELKTSSTCSVVVLAARVCFKGFNSSIILLT